MLKDLALAIDAAKQAGNIIRDQYGTRQTITKKGINDFVTKTDTAAERAIIDRLRHSKYSIVSEESDPIQGTDTHKRWVIDPLDGTNNFIHGLPFVTVSIALVDDTDDVLLGVVYDPLRDECYYASKKGGAYMNKTLLSVSRHATFEASIILIEHGRIPNSVERYTGAIKNLIAKNDVTILRYGGSALMLCYVAKGSAEAFVSFGDEFHDYAAGLVIAQEAGAVITDWRGQTWDNSSAYVAVSAPGMQPEIISHLQKLQV